MIILRGDAGVPLAKKMKPVLKRTNLDIPGIFIQSSVFYFRIFPMNISPGIDLTCPITTLTACVPLSNVFSLSSFNEMHC